MRVFAFLFLAFAIISTSALAQDLSGEYKADFECAKNLQDALKNDDKLVVANLIAYPLEREYPLPPIKTVDEFLARWDDYFDTENIKQIVDDAASQIGWRGVQLVNGMIWFKDGKVFKIQFRTKKFEEHFSKAKDAESAGINPEARSYKKLIVSCETKTKVIRIQEHEDGIHYFVWKKGESLSDKPELNLIGSLMPDGNGGNSHLTFDNHNYSYVLDNPVICEGPVCQKTLTINKDGKELSNQNCN